MPAQLGHLGTKSPKRQIRYTTNTGGILGDGEQRVCCDYALELSRPLSPPGTQRRP